MTTADGITALERRFLQGRNYMNRKHCRYSSSKSQLGHLQTLPVRKVMSAARSGQCRICERTITL